MPDLSFDRDHSTPMETREGAHFILALDGPTGEALHVNVGILDPRDGKVLKRQFNADEAEDIANNMLELVQILRERK